MLELLTLYALVALVVANAIIILDMFDVVDVTDDAEVVAPSVLWPALGVALVVKGYRWARDHITSVRLF